MTDSTVRYSLGEELAHSITHGIGVALSIAGLVLLVTLAATRGDAWHVVSCSIFGTTLVFLYTASTLYHSITHPGAKKVLRVFDHAAIFLLIAGTYTPFTLVTLRGAWGWTLFVIIWGLAIVGIIVDSRHKEGSRALQMVIYLLMGWLIVVAMYPLTRALPTGGLVLLVLGGVFYTSGMIFYAIDERMKHAHGIWHLFVLAGSISHFLAILLYVL